MFLRANIIFAYLCKTPPKKYKSALHICHLNHSRLVLARNVVPTDWDLPQKMLTVPKLFTIPKLWPKQFQNLNWKTLLILEWHSEPSLPSCRQRRADAQNRHLRIVLMFVEILPESSRSLRETPWSQYVACVCVCRNLPARGRQRAGGIEGRTGGIHLLLLFSHRIRITTLFGQNMANVCFVTQ